MYIPADFREERLPVLHDFIAANGFAPVVTQGAEGLEASHLPWLIDRAAGPFGTLRAHLARANRHWRRIADGADALVIFGGPNAYVSPSWYPSKAEHGRVVPTWNYIVVHVRGRARIVEDRAWLRDFLPALTARHEAGRPAPWAVSDAPADYVEDMMGAIVGIEVPITAIEGKWKLSQNRPVADRRGTAAGLAAEDASGAQAVAAAMREGLAEDP
ncbi:MAG TPA: FMN-binding negative transcriptional regulator [Hyphomicrobiales bacterium]|nr:FMN-binding negative transcriptional regulator [Hyphomicrobiales bacterium]